MRFSFHTALPLPLPLPLPLTLAVLSLGTLGCSYPFSVDAKSSVSFPLGAAVNCAEANAGVLEGTIPANGEPDADGSLTSFVHTFYAGNKCALHADWQGPLVNMDHVRDDAHEQMRDLGLDPDDVDVYIRKIEPTVTAVDFDNEAVMPGVSYHALVGVPGAKKLITLDADEGAELAHPKVTVLERSKRRFLRVANESWREGTPMPGLAAVDIEIDLDDAGMQAELPQAIRVDFALEIVGDAAARQMVHQEDVDALFGND